MMSAEERVRLLRQAKPNSWVAFSAVPHRVAHWRHGGRLEGGGLGGERAAPLGRPDEGLW
jgi:hypothetical protein